MTPLYRDARVLAWIILVLTAPAFAGCLGANPLDNVKPPTPVDRPLVPLPELVNVPEYIDAGRPFSVVWRIPASARAPDSASLHFGNESVFSPSDGGTYAHEIIIPAVSGKGSIDITAPTTYATIYLRVRVVDEGRSYWSNERSISVIPRGDGTGLVILRAPQFVKQGEMFNVRVEVRSSTVADVSRLELRMGVGGNESEDAYPLVLASTTGRAPGTFTLSGFATEPGPQKYRVIATIGNLTRWTTERALLVENDGVPTIELESFLSWARANEKVSASWRVHYPGYARLNVTQLRWGESSYADAAAVTLTMYPESTREQTGVAPSTFSDGMKPGVGKYYMRVLVVRDDVSYWSQEYTFTVAP